MVLVIAFLFLLLLLSCIDDYIFLKEDSKLTKIVNTKDDVTGFLVILLSKNDGGIHPKLDRANPEIYECIETPRLK